MHKKPEEEILNLDWSSLSHEDKAELLVRQSVYLETARKFLHSNAIYGSDLRNLFVMMLSVFLMVMLEVENKNIILGLISSQIIFLMMSRAAMHSSAQALKEMQDSYIQFLKSKRNKNTYQ